MNDTKFLKLMKMVDNSFIKQVIVHTPTKQELENAYRLLNECGLGMRITQKMLNDKYRFGESTGLCITDEGVCVTHINDIYSDFVLSVNRLNKYLCQSLTHINKERKNIFIKKY